MRDCCTTRYSGASGEIYTEFHKINQLILEFWLEFIMNYEDIRPEECHHG